jgi:hypothetical protein
VSLLIVVLGSMAGQWMSVMHKLGNRRPVVLVWPPGLRISRPRAVSWQAALFIGLLLWLFPDSPLRRAGIKE